MLQQMAPGTLMSPGLCRQGQGTGRERAVGGGWQGTPSLSHLTVVQSPEWGGEGWRHFLLPLLSPKPLIMEPCGDSVLSAQLAGSSPHFSNNPLTPFHPPAFSLSSPWSSLGEKKNLEEGRGEGRHEVVGRGYGPTEET